VGPVVAIALIWPRVRAVGFMGASSGMLLPAVRDTIAISVAAVGVQRLDAVRRSRRCC